MGVNQSHVDQAIANPGSPPSPPPPSQSTLGRQNFLSYFLPITTPDITHEHSPPTTSDIAEITSILTSLRLPPELVPKILDEAEFWTPCRRLSRKHVTVIDHATGPRDLPGSWKCGQEEELVEEREVEGSGLKDRKGEVWLLVSPKIGCTLQERSSTSPEGPSRETQVPVDGIGDSGQGSEGKGWSRMVVVETLSKDQGWSSRNPGHYGV